MSKIQDYQQAIRIFSIDNFNAREVAIQLAQERPDLFLKYVNRPDQQAKDELDALLRDTHTRLGRVAAVKLHREKTGSSLKEAVDYCRAVCDDPIPAVQGTNRATE